MNFSKNHFRRHSPPFSRFTLCLMGLIPALYGAANFPARAQSYLPHGYLAGKGDLNGDGQVTLGDALLTSRLIHNQGNFTPQQMIAADANGDGSLTDRDAAAVLDAAVYYSAMKPQPTPWRASPNGNLVVYWGTITNYVQYGVTMSFGLDQKVKDLTGIFVQFKYPTLLTPWVQSWTDHDGQYQDEQGNFINPSVERGLSSIFPEPIHGPFEWHRFSVMMKRDFPMLPPSMFQIVHAEAVDSKGNALPIGVVSSLLGDDNVNGRVDVEDAILSLRMAVGTWPAAPQNDVDGDGASTPADTRIILEAALNGKPVYR